MLDPTKKKKPYVWNKYKVRNKNIIKDSSWITKNVSDPRYRSWYIGSRNAYPEMYWTDLYLFNTTNELGITVSQSWKDSHDDSLFITIAYDISLKKLSDILKKLKPTKNSQVMISKDSNYLLYDDKTKSVHIIDKNSNEQHAQLHQLSLKNLDNKPFQFEKEGQKWWGSAEQFRLTNQQKLNIIIILPESDFLVEINNLQLLLFIGFIVITILIFFIVRIHNKEIKNSNLLLMRGEIIKKKNTEIISSINCAKRTQEAMLPDDEEIQKCLGEAFVIYMPKDIVAGDFYWVQNQHPYVYF